MSLLPDPVALQPEPPEFSKPVATKQRNLFKLVPLDTPAKLPRRPYVVEGLIHDNTTFLIFGAPQAGKSFLALDLVLSVNAGIEWMGHKTNKGLSIYVASEGRDGISMRTAGWKAAHPNLDASLARHLEGADLNLLDRAHVDDVIAKINEVGGETEASPKAIIIDTLSSAIPGADENNQATMSTVMSHLRRIAEKTGAAVGLVHHVAKNNPHDPRGNNVLTAGMDTSLLVAERSNRRVMEVVKQRDGPTGMKIPFALVPVSVRCTDDTSATTCVPSVLSSAGQGDDNGGTDASPEDEALLKFILGMPPGPARYETESNGSDVQLDLSEVKRRAIDEHYAGNASRDAKRKKFERSLDRLQAAGMVRREGDILVIITQPEAAA